MMGLAGRLLPGPNEVADDPTMNLNSGSAGVALLNDFRQGIEVGVDDGGAGIAVGIVKGVPPPPHLDNHGIEVVLAAVGGELLDLRGVEKAGTEGVHPQAAELGSGGEAAQRGVADRGEVEQPAKAAGRTVDV